MSLFDKLFGFGKSKPTSTTPTPPKLKYKHYGQKPNPDAKRHQKHGPKKD